LLKQRGGLAILLRLVERCLCLGGFLDLGGNDFIAHLHRHSIDRRILVQGDQIGGIERRRCGIGEGLHDGDGGGVARYRGDAVFAPG
jgi:hypothetical protein